MANELDPGGALGLLFDWDGTLADTQELNDLALRDTLAGVQIGGWWRSAMQRSCSGGGRTVITAVLERLPHISGFIEVLVTRDDVSRGEPAPDIFLLAAERLGLPPSACLVYEDSDAGMEAAAAAGMRAVDVRKHRAPSGSTS